MKFPALPAYVSFTLVPGDGVFIVSNRGADLFSGSLFEELIPLLDGLNEHDQLLTRLSDRYPLVDVLYALRLLANAGYLTEGAPSPDCPHSDYGALFGPVTRPVSVSIFNQTNIDLSLLNDLLVHHALADSSGSPLAIVVVDDYLDSRLIEFNASALSCGRPWMLVRASGSVLWIGPTLVPNRTACWQCLAQRLRANRPVERYLEQQTGIEILPKRVTAPALASLRASLVINEILRWKSAEEQPFPELLTFDPTTALAERHPVVRRPQCEACGSGRTASSSPGACPIDISEPHTSPMSMDGGIRSEPPSATYERLKHHISAVTGVVSAVRRLETDDDRVHVYVAGQNFAATSGTLRLLNRSLRNQSSGKGVSEAQAKTSALCEAIERYASVYQGTEEYVLASFAELGESAIHPNACMLFSDAQYHDRDDWNQDGDHFAWVPRPLNLDEKLWWSPVWDISSRSRRYLPTAHVYFHSHELADPVGTSVCAVDSNGHAAGSSYAEAVLQGMLELIERDSVALWWYPRSTLAGVNLSSFKSEYLDACISYHARKGRHLWVLDATSDLAIPTFVALSRDVHSHGRIALGFGTHLDAGTAIKRAVGELNQLLGSVDARAAAEDPHRDGTSRWIGSATTESETYLLPGADQKDAATYPRTEITVDDALAKCIAKISEAGIPVFVADLTRPDVALKVVKVVAPGLRHFWARFAPGRLYEVPVKMGRARSISEADLNRTAMFL